MGPAVRGGTAMVRHGGKVLSGPAGSGANIQAVPLPIVFSARLGGSKACLLASQKLAAAGGCACGRHCTGSCCRPAGSQGEADPTRLRMLLLLAPCDCLQERSEACSRCRRQ